MASRDLKVPSSISAYKGYQGCDWLKVINTLSFDWFLPNTSPSFTRFALKLTDYQLMFSVRFIENQPISLLSLQNIAMPGLMGSEPPKKQFFNFFWSKYQLFCKIDKNEKFLEFFFTKYRKKGGFKNPQIMIESTIISKTIRFIKMFIKTNVFRIAFYI